MGKSTAAEPAPGTPCPGPLSAGWRRAEVAAALEPSRATCAQAVGPGRARIRKSNPLRVSDSWPGPWRPREAVRGLSAHQPSPSLEKPRASPGGIPRTGGGPRARRGAAGPLLPPPAPPCHRPAPSFQSGFCCARRPAPRLRAPRGGWLGARRGWRCAPPRLHCCAPGAQGSHTRRVRPAARRSEAAQCTGMGAEGAPGWGSGLRR